VRAALLVLMSTSACSFEGTGGTTPGDNDGGATDDGATFDALSSDGGNLDGRNLDGGTTLACAASGPGLSLCLDFEFDRDSPTTAVDGSGNGNDAQLQNVARVARTTPSGATEFAAQCNTCQILVAETPVLDLTTAITIESWVQINTKPNRRYGLVDNNEQYALFYTSRDRVRFTITSVGAQTLLEADAPPLGTWFHVAGVYDQGQGTASIYVDGSLATARPYSTAISTGSMAGTAIAADLARNGTVNQELDGAIDNARIWSRALSPAELCQSAGLSNCP
jgi:hypothetical protein